jgi:predicted alpha/beta-fold hydrolase
VNAPLDLLRCCEALERPGNWIYQAYFVRVLCGQIRSVRRVRPVPGPAALPRRLRTVRRFDAAFTAPDAGFSTPEAYYAWASAGPHLPRVRVPGMVLSATNDPFVPHAAFAPYRDPASPSLRWLHPSRGGHMGYRQAGREPYWAAGALLDFVEEKR